MQDQLKLAQVLPVILASPTLAACALLGTAIDPLSVPANVKEYAERIPRIEMSTKAPCWMQRQHAKQEAFLDATIEGKPKSYVADCDQRKPKKEASKTS